MNKYIKLADAHDVVSSTTKLHGLKGTGWIDVGLNQQKAVEIDDERKVYAIYYDRIDAGEKTFTPYVRFVCTRDIDRAVSRFVTSEFRPLRRMCTQVLNYVSIDEAMSEFEKDGWQVYLNGVMRFTGGRNEE